MFTLQTFSSSSLSGLADERLNFPGYFQAGYLGADRPKRRRSLAFEQPFNIKDGRFIQRMDIK